MSKVSYSEAAMVVVHYARELPCSAHVGPIEVSRHVSCMCHSYPYIYMYMYIPDLNFIHDVTHTHHVLCMSVVGIVL